ncbi:MULTISPECIES: hypothetical protein [Pantoea]|jgi:hypothetical protein|uniref:hypothetical protein n=1 Tax=Pantoea TaxID=53335 RepID=UPI001F214DE7|nr:MULTISPECIES: hypothetical protein [Pantoea]UIL53907.1 hypothetical protein LZU96_08250 [Pantoea agglomerans]
MVTINSPATTLLNKRKIILGGVMLGCSMICVLMTILFLYVSNTANRRVAEIRQEYRNIAAKRDARVDLLTNQVTTLQHKLDALPDRTAIKTVDKVKEVVIEKEVSPMHSQPRP